MTTHKKTALFVACAFFVFWLAVLYAGADHPPPPGFILVVILDLAAAVIVYLRVPGYINWHVTRKSFRILRVILEGFIVGLVFGLIPALISQADPEVSVTTTDRMIWFAVLGTVGTINAVLVYMFSVLISKGFAKFSRNK